VHYGNLSRKMAIKRYSQRLLLFTSEIERYLLKNVIIIKIWQQ